MKYFSFLLLLFGIQLAPATIFAQGNYAGTFKKLIGHTYTNDRKIPGLEGYVYRQGDLISDIGYGEPQFITILLKGKSAAVVYSAKTDTAKNIFTIIDIIQITNILPGWEIKTAGCKEGDTEGQIVIALVNPGKKEYTTAVKKAWLCEMDRLRIEAISTKNIKCINEGFGE